MSDEATQAEGAGVPAAPNPASDDDALWKAVAEETRSVLEAWRGRLVEAVASGRAATRMARMATARAGVDLRRVALPETPSNDPALQEAVNAYLRRAASTVANASHEIERNRYTLQALQNQLEKLAALHGQIIPADADSAARGNNEIRRVGRHR